MCVDSLDKIHKSFQLCSLLSVEYLIIFDDIVQPLIDMYLFVTFIL
jgi:hypothetical protein